MAPMLYLLLSIWISAVPSYALSAFACDQSKCTSSAFAGGPGDLDCLVTGAEEMSCADDFEGVVTGHSEWEYGLYWMEYTCCPKAKMQCSLTVIDKDGGPSVSVSWPSVETVYSDTKYDTAGTVYASSNDDHGTVLSAEHFLDSCDIFCGAEPVTQYYHADIVTFYDIKKAALSAVGKDPELAGYTDLLHYYEGSPDDYLDRPETTSWNDDHDDGFDDSFRRRLIDDFANMRIDESLDSQMAFPEDLCDAGYLVVDSNVRRPKVLEYMLDDSEYKGLSSEPIPGSDPAMVYLDTRRDYETTCVTGDNVMRIGPFTVNADFNGYVLEFRKRLNDKLNEDYAEDIRAQYCSDGSDSDCIESLDAVSFARYGTVDDDYDVMDSIYSAYWGTTELDCVIAVHFKRPETPVPEQQYWARAPPLNQNGILTATATDAEGAVQLNAFWVYGIAALLTVLVTVNATCLVMHGRCSNKQYESANYESDAE